MSELWGDVDWVDSENHEPLQPVIELDSQNESARKKNAALGIAEVLGSIAIADANHYAIEAHDKLAYVPALLVMSVIAVDGFKRLFLSSGIEQSFKALRKNT